MHTNDEFEGIGTGIAIVKKVLITLEGEIWLNVQPNKRTTFYITLKK